jgi:hypothetical protein
MTGHIKLHRRLLEWQWLDKPNMVALFIYLLLKANFKKTKYQKIIIERGQLITGRLKLATVLGLTEKQVRTCLYRLEDSGEISIRRANKFSVITICKYEDYQSINNTEGQREGQQGASERATSKEGKKGKEEKNIIPTPIAWPENFVLGNIYSKKFEELNGHFKNLTEPGFLKWKKFVDFILKKGYEEVFNSKFISPQDFEKISPGFPEAIWDETLKELLSTGIETSMV